MSHVKQLEMSHEGSSEDKSTGVVKSESFRQSSFSKGSSVEANYKNQGELNPGQIIDIKLDGTYDVEYVDGVVEEGVRGDKIRERDEIKFPLVLKFHHLFFFVILLGVNNF